MEEAKKPTGAKVTAKAPVKRKIRRNVEKNMIYCRKCGLEKTEEHFFKAVDPLDSNGFMSICKECIGELYNKIFQTEHTIERSFLRLCRMINLRYSEEAIQATINHMNTQKKEPDDPALPGIYKSKLLATQKTEAGKRDKTEDLTFREPSHVVIDDPLDDSNESYSLKEFWGDGIGNYDDYAFLEGRMAHWKESFSCQNASEEFYLKEVCHKELELKRARQENKSVDSILTAMNNLLKNSALTPAQATASESGKMHDTWGTLIRQIEETTPAEYYKDKELFRDFDHFEKRYILPYIVRSLKNFILGSRDFNIAEDEDVDEDEYMNVIGAGEDQANASDTSISE